MTTDHQLEPMPRKVDKGFNPIGTNESNNENESIEKIYPPKQKVLLTMIALFLVFFLVALDRTIIGTAIPTISTEFGSFSDIAWYESAFLLPFCVLQLSFGLVFKYYSAKYVLLILAVIFEIGSIICAAAPTSNALIAGRAITGIGGAGIAPGAYFMISLLVPLEDRPKFLGSLGSAFGISSILGPILGGYLTGTNWRWCFWINVPIGAVSIVLLLFLAPNIPPPAASAKGWFGKIKQLDPIGFILIGPSISCLVSALQLGGKDHDWSAWRVIVMLVVFAVLLVIFIGHQIHQQDNSTIPPRIIRKRTVLVACLSSFCIGSALIIYSFYLPIWFQVVQGKSPQASGLSLLPLLLSNVASVIIGGILVSVIGYYTPFAIAGSAILLIGTTLITTWTADIGQGKWIGYQFITGVGLGLCLQQPAIAIQTVLDESDIAIGTSIVNFIVFLGGTIFITVAQLLFERELVAKLLKIAPDLDPSKLAGSGAASLRSLVDPSRLDEALAAYNDSMKPIWYIGVAMASVSFIASFGFPWKSIKANPKKSDKEDKGNIPNKA